MSKFRERLVGRAPAGAALILTALPFLPAPGYIVPGVIGLALAGIAGLGVYFVGAVAMRMPEVAGVMRRLRR